VSAAAVEDDTLIPSLPFPSSSVMAQEGNATDGVAMMLGESVTALTTGIEDILAMPAVRDGLTDAYNFAPPLPPTAPAAAPAAAAGQDEFNQLADYENIFDDFELSFAETNYNPGLLSWCDGF